MVANVWVAGEHNVHIVYFKKIQKKKYVQGTADVAQSRLFPPGKMFWMSSALQTQSARQSADAVEIHPLDTLWPLERVWNGALNSRRIFYNQRNENSSKTAKQDSLQDAVTTKRRCPWVQ